MLAPRQRPPPGRVAHALTLLEVMIVIAILGVLIALVAPSMREMIGMQRLRGIAAQAMTDMQFARSESLSRNQFLGVTVRNVAAESMSCYTLFTSNVNPLSMAALDPAQCNCTSLPGNACAGTQREVRIVQLPRSEDIQLRLPPAQEDTFAYNPVTGGIGNVIASSSVVPDHDFCFEVTRRPRGRLRVTVNIAGRPSMCSPDLSVPGFDACPEPVELLRNCPGIPAP